MNMNNAVTEDVNIYVRLVLQTPLCVFLRQ